MASLRTLIGELGKNEAIKEVMFGKETNNIKVIEHFLRTYEGKTPYFAFILEKVGRQDLPLFISTGVDYAPLDEQFMRIKAELPEVDETATDTAQIEEEK